MGRAKQHYVDNNAFLAAISEYKAQVDEWKKVVKAQEKKIALWERCERSGDWTSWNKLQVEHPSTYARKGSPIGTKPKPSRAVKPRVSEFIGECILKIATHVGFKPNFINYTYRDEMIGDAVENCLVYIDNFDPKKSRNPFAYFTQIVYFAFVRRIERERRQTYVKFKSLEMSDAFFAIQHGNDDPNNYDNTYVDYLQENMSGIIEDFEAKKRNKQRKKKPEGLEKYWADEEPKPASRIVRRTKASMNA